MESKIISVSLYDLQENTGQIEGVPANPRTIKKSELKKLMNSVLLFPQMLLLRPITVFDNVVLAGNMRLRSICSIAPMNVETLGKTLKEFSEFRDKPAEVQAEIFEFWCSFIKDPDKKILIQNISNATPGQLQEFVIKDNIDFGDHDYQMLADSWNHESLRNWGLNLPKNWEVPREEPADNKAENTKKSIQISFNAEDYVEAYRAIQWFRDNKIYLGKDVLNFLSQLKNKHGENINN